MTQHRSSSTLNLLVPWELPQAISLTEEEQRLARHALNLVLSALAESSPAEGLKKLDRAWFDLGEVEVQPVEIETTQTALKPWEVEDYDRYFHTNHVQAESPALCLVQGLLAVVQSFFYLRCHTPHLSPEQVERQKQGFISYIHLLERIFNL